MPITISYKVRIRTTSNIRRSVGERLLVYVTGIAPRYWGCEEDESSFYTDLRLTERVSPLRRFIELQHYAEPGIMLKDDNFAQYEGLSNVYNSADHITPVSDYVTQNTEFLQRAINSIRDGTSRFPSSEEARTDAIERYEREMASLSSLTINDLTRTTVYYGVEISFITSVTSLMFEFIIERATRFASNNGLELDNVSVTRELLNTDASLLASFSEGRRVMR